MLRQDVIAAWAEALTVAHALCHRVIGGLRFEILKAIAGHEDGLAGFIHAVVGAADTLQQARRALGRAHLDDAVYIAPVDAQIEAGGADQGAQLALGHGALDLAPRLHGQGAVVNADGVFGFICVPQFLEDEFGQKAGVAEYQRDFVTADFLDELRDRMLPAVPRPRHAALGQ